uniref:Fibrinogen alpha chain-like n=1 Tax=Crassostrea virginica TaxID=6565 RepID=A0A8B8BN85_CRAVI|nr:fibrinogen alpha chain-like [Crassostrea virginica]
MLRKFSCSVFRKHSTIEFLLRFEDKILNFKKIVIFSKESRMQFQMLIFIIFHLAFSNEIQISNFYNQRSAPKISTVNVFYESLLTRGTSLSIQCGAKCVALSPSCMGIEVCEDGVCRLWNGSFPRGTVEEFFHTCRRYIKWPTSVRTEETSIAMEVTVQSTSSVTITSPPVLSSQSDSNSSESNSTPHVPLPDTTTARQDSSTDSEQMVNLTNPTFSTEPLTSSDSGFSPDTLSTAQKTTDDSLITTSSTVSTNTAYLTSSERQFSSNTLSDTSTSMTLSSTFSDSSSNDDEIITSSHLTTSSFDITSSVTASTDSHIHECQKKYEFSDGNVKAIPCVNDTHSWILIQRRFNGYILFNRSWSEYENGFGSTTSEFWLGNQYISELTYAGYTVLKIDLMSFSGEFREIEYNFHVENITNKYKLHVSERSSSGIDCLSASNLEMFTMFDQDNDKSKAKNCAVDMISGWWFEHSTACTEGNLNGKR